GSGVKNWESGRGIGATAAGVANPRSQLFLGIPSPNLRVFFPQPVGRAFAMVAKRSDGNSLASECVKSNEGDEEIIKVYLKARADHEEPVTQLKSEVRHIQETRPSSRHHPQSASRCRPTGRAIPEDPKNPPGAFPGAPGSPFPAEFTSHPSEIRESSEGFFSPRGFLRDLQEDPPARERSGMSPGIQGKPFPVFFQRTVARYQEEVERAGSALRRAEKDAAEKEMEVEELQRLLASMEKEHRNLLARMEAGEAELERLRKVEGDKVAQQDRSAQLEKEVAALREKIHHLDDMLKSQQRKVRQMIEQLQNSKTVIQAKDAAIQELKERVSYLEAENLEMHDRIEHLIEQQVSRGGLSARARSKSEYVSSKRLPGPKPLPLIRVVET
uniref:Uncharacterized protein n=1 Tax=Corvus moneduloides TaxID=1196302 RepID=A0A8U7N5Y5_CORMO